MQVGQFSDKACRLEDFLIDHMATPDISVGCTNGTGVHSIACTNGAVSIRTIPLVGSLRTRCLDVAPDQGDDRHSRPDILEA